MLRHQPKHRTTNHQMPLTYTLHPTMNPPPPTARADLQHGHPQMNQAHRGTATVYVKMGRHGTLLVMAACDIRFATARIPPPNPLWHHVHRWTSSRHLKGRCVNRCGEELTWNYIVHGQETVPGSEMFKSTMGQELLEEPGVMRDACKLFCCRDDAPSRFQLDGHAKDRAPSQQLLELHGCTGQMNEGLLDAARCACVV